MSNPHHPLASVEAKVARAKEHLDAFNSEVQSFLETTTYGFITKVYEADSYIQLTYNVSPDAPPVRLSVLAGDFLFNLRSALDHLVCALVRINKPTHSCSGRAFPIYSDQEKYKASRNEVLGGLPEEIKAVFDGLQPFMRIDGMHALGILNTLNNRDKHRAVNFTVGFTSRASFVFYDHFSNPVHTLEFNKPLHNGDTHRIDVPRQVKAGAKVDAQGTAVIAFLGSDPWAGQPVGSVLNPLLQYVELSVLPRFRPFFS